MDTRSECCIPDSQTPVNSLELGVLWRWPLMLLQMVQVVMRFASDPFAFMAEIKNKATHHHHPAINYRHASEALMLLNALKLPVSQFILSQLQDHPRGITVQDLVDKAKLNLSAKKTQSVISDHLATLRKRGVIRYERDGKYHTYFLCHDRMKGITSALNNFFNNK